MQPSGRLQFSAQLPSIRRSAVKKAALGQSICEVRIMHLSHNKHQGRTENVNKNIDTPLSLCRTEIGRVFCIFWGRHELRHPSLVGNVLRSMSSADRPSLCIRSARVRAQPELKFSGCTTHLFCGRVFEEKFEHFYAFEMLFALSCGRAELCVLRKAISWKKNLHLSPY